jgi:hypothetical protein
VVAISLSMDKMIDQLKHRQKNWAYNTRGTDGKQTRRFGQKKTLK